MSSKGLTKSALAVLGCAGASVAAPLIAPYLATISLPFFGAMLAGVITNEQLQDKLVDAIGNTAAGFLTNIGSYVATDKLPGALSPDHNFHLERMLATAYLISLKAIEQEFKADADEKLQVQAAQIFPSLKARIERGLKQKDLSALFPVQAINQPTGTAFANRFSAENVTLLIADEEKWHEQLGEEVETTLRRWLDEERDTEAQVAPITQLSLARDTQLPEPLRSRLRAEMPHSIAHQISELVKHDEFKESWIAFQRAHLQGIGRVVERIETSQEDIRESVVALAQRIEGFASQDEFVAAIADKLQVFLSQTTLPPDELARLLERQSEELRGLEERLGAKFEQGTERLSTEGKENTAQLSEQIQSLDKKVEQVKEEILQSAVRAARNRLKQLPAPPRDFTGRETELRELRQALRQGGATISGVQGMGGVGKTALALVLADEFKDQYPEAQIYLDLRGTSKQPLPPAEVMWHVVSSLQPETKRPDDDQLPSLFNSVLDDKRVLLFYDNAGDPAQIAPQLRWLPPRQCLLLVTSRKRLGLRGMSEKNLDEMSKEDANALLLKIEPRIGGHAPAIAEQCGYLPIALCAAASVLKIKTALAPEDYLNRLRIRKERLSLYDVERDLSVEACFGESYDLLNEELPRRWRMLAIFPTDFDAPAAAAVWQTDVEAAKDSLAELEEYSLLDWEEAAQRYTLHDLARDFADTRLSAAEREQAGLLHATHYLQILSTADDLFQKGGAAIAGGLSLFDNERVNIEAGQEWAAVRFAGNEQAAQLCNMYPDAGAFVLSLRQHPRDLIRWLEAALPAAQQLRDARAAEGRHLGNLGNAYVRLDETRRAIEFHEQYLNITREIGDRRGEGNALGNMGVAYADLGETRRAIEFYEQALVISREISDRRGEGADLGNLGIVYKDLGDTEQAIGYMEEAVKILEEIESPNANVVRGWLEKLRGKSG